MPIQGVTPESITNPKFETAKKHSVFFSRNNTTTDIVEKLIVSMNNGRLEKEITITQQKNPNMLSYIGGAVYDRYGLKAVAVAGAMNVPCFKQHSSVDYSYKAAFEVECLTDSTLTIEMANYKPENVQSINLMSKPSAFFKTNSDQPSYWDSALLKPIVDKVVIPVNKDGKYYIEIDPKEYKLETRCFLLLGINYLANKGARYSTQINVSTSNQVVNNIQINHREEADVISISETSKTVDYNTDYTFININGAYPYTVKKQ